MSTVYSLIATITISILIIILILLLILRKKKLFIITSVLSITLILLVTVIRLVDTKDYFNIGIVDMKYDNHLENVSLVLDEDNYLYDNINKAKVEFLNTNGSYQPVYLNDMEHYLLIVFSVKDKLYEDELFFQSDYQYYENVDRLYLINKENGAVTFLRSYRSIGKTFDLSRAKDYDSSVIIPVLLPHSLDVSYLSLYIITNHFYDQGYERYLEVFPAIAHYDDGVLENYSYVKDFIYDKNNNLFQIDNLGVVTYSLNRFNFDGETISSSTTYGNEIFKDLNYVTEGYYKEYLSEIYYLDNDLNIIKLVNKEQIVVKTLDSLNEWDLYFNSLI